MIKHILSKWTRITLIRQGTVRSRKRRNHLLLKFLEDRTVPASIYVSATWAGDTVGTIVTDPILTNGFSAAVGSNAFSTVGEAIAAETSPAKVIFVNPGTYSESVSAGPEPITLDLQGGAISFNSITDTAVDPLTIVLADSSVTWTVGSGTLYGDITGAGNLAVSGPGSLVLLGSDVYTGSSTINSGATLQIGNGGSVGQTQPNLLYDNGLLNGTINGLAIYAPGPYTASDSFTLPSASTLTEVQLGLWALPGDVPTGVSWSLGSTPFGNDIGSGTSPLSSTFQYTNVYSYDLYESTFSLPQALSAGTHYLTLTSATDSLG